MNVLQSKSNDVLISDLKNLVLKERETLTEILNHLKEIDSRKLYLERGYSSLFSFLTEELKYSESAAYRRIQAMRLITEVPEVKEKIESGEISLSVASQVESFIRHKEAANPLSRDEKLSLVLELQGSSSRTCEKKLISIAPETALPADKTKAVTPDKTLIQFLAANTLIEKIEKLKNLLGHQHEKPGYEVIFEKAIDLALAKLDPETRAKRRQESLPASEVKGSVNPDPSVVPTKVGISRSTGDPCLRRDDGLNASARYIPQSIRDKVWTKNQGRCSYIDPQTGRRCSSRYALQIDHKYPYLFGGDHSEDNLQLLCRNHNAWKGTRILTESLPVPNEGVGKTF